MLRAAACLVVSYCIQVELFLDARFQMTWGCPDTYSSGVERQR